MRRLLNIGTAFVLVLSCWGGLFAAPCPHGCHATAASHARAYAEQPDAEPAGHCHTTTNDGEAMQMPGMSGHKAPDVATYEVNDQAGAQVAGVLGAACDHCVGRAEVPSSSFTERDLSQTKKGDAANAPAPGGRVIHAAAGFVKEIIPHDDGPPASPVHRHVMIGVFRI